MIQNSGASPIRIASGSSPVGTAAAPAARSSSAAARCRRVVPPAADSAGSSGMVGVGRLSRGGTPSPGFRRLNTTPSARLT